MEAHMSNYWKKAKIKLSFVMSFSSKAKRKITKQKYQIIFANTLRMCEKIFPTNFLVQQRITKNT